MIFCDKALVLVVPSAVLCAPDAASLPLNTTPQGLGAARVGRSLTCSVILNCLLVCFVCSFTLFQKRKPGGQNQWSEKLPDFVKRLEAALFNSAATKASAWVLAAVLDAGLQFDIADHHRVWPVCTPILVAPRQTSSSAELKVWQCLCGHISTQDRRSCVFICFAGRV